ncbi:MAG: hypothetical protein JAY74_28075, partial [Candidatus Thiodiazotropha taylori]|nr:hypothetical protein [Candidatus Thiodiazotropha taylori]
VRRLAVICVHLRLKWPSKHPERLEILLNPDRIARPLEFSGGVAWSQSGIPFDLNRYGDNHVCQF